MRTDMLETDRTPNPHEPSMVEAYLGLDPISVCIRLSAALGDAAHGWRLAAEVMDKIGEDDLAERMRKVARAREKFAVELSNVISGRSGSVDEEHTVVGQLRAWWLEVRAITSRNKRAAVLKVCRSGSQSLIDEYATALGTPLPDAIRDIVVRQAESVRRTGSWLDTV
jgi:uncharacterized protein (TIGR02284 family)